MMVYRHCDSAVTELLLCLQHQQDFLCGSLAVSNQHTRPTSKKTAHTLRLQVMSSWLTRFHERARSASWAGAQGSYGRLARAVCTQSRRRCDTSCMAQRSAGPQYSAASCTPTDTQARGTRLYSGPTSLLQKEKQKEWKWWGISQAGIT